MNSAMLDYDDFDLERETQDRYPLREAVKKAAEIRGTEKNGFVRIKNVGMDEFVVVKVPAAEVYAEWMGRMRQRLARFSRRNSSR